MIVAIAGPSADLERCARVRDALVDVGIAIAYDWIAGVQQARAAGRFDDDLTLDERCASAFGCLSGVSRADVVLWLASPSVGAAYEVGFAAAAKKLIVVSGPNLHPIYGVPKRLRFERDESAVAFLVDASSGFA